MKYKVMYTAGAKKDLRNIFRYISEELLAPENAAGQTERIMTAIRKLDTMPNRNRLYEEEPWHSRGLRITVSLVFHIHVAYGLFCSCRRKHTCILSRIILSFRSSPVISSIFFTR